MNANKAAKKDVKEPARTIASKAAKKAAKKAVQKIAKPIAKKAKKAPAKKTLKKSTKRSSAKQVAAKGSSIVETSAVTWSQSSTGPSFEQVQLAAYHRWLQGGADDLDNWLSAEGDLRGKKG